MRLYFHGMMCSSYLVQSLNISNKSARDIEKYVLNVADDVMSSKGVVVKNAFSMLWSDMDTSCNVFFCKLVGRNFLEKWKSERHWLKNATELRGKLRYRSLPMMWSEGGSVSHSS